nr:hypothetical protein [Tanacetum cinerariifolium]
EKRKKSRPAGLRRLKKERSIEDINQDAEIALVDKAQGRMHDADLFRVDDLEVTAASVKDSVAPTTTTTADVDDELTLAKTLIAIKAAKLKKDQITLDKEEVRKIEAEMRAEIKEEERIAREKDEEQAKVADDDTTELKRCLEIVPDDDDDVAIEATPISSKSPTIVDYKIYKEGKKSYFRIIRADGNAQNYLTFKTMFKNFNREDLEVLRSIIKEIFKKTKPVDDIENLLF